MAEEPSMETYQKIADFLKSKTKYKPEMFIICGSGLGKLATIVKETEEFDYEDIPGFPVSTVAGHAGKLIFGMLAGKEVVCMKGRFHSYEGYPMWKVTLPVVVMKLLGVKIMIATNAAGGLNEKFKVGDIMLIKDHVSIPGLAGKHPLVGRNLDEMGPRFPSLTKAYAPELRALAKKCTTELGYDDFVHEGVYCQVSGPSYETPAELRFLHVSGIDCVGMSTAPEVTVAVHAGIKCLAFSLVTNKCAFDVDAEEPNHEEVQREADKRSNDMIKLVETIASGIDLSNF